MSRAAARTAARLSTKGDTTFRMSHLFPEYNGERKPLPKQEEIFQWTRAGLLSGGGAVYCGGKGSGKTIVGSAWDIWIHHVPKWHGCKTLIGRETYPALLTSTANEFFDMLPDPLVAGYSRPTKNAMGWVDWKVGGTTFLCSLSDSTTWESANLASAWVDEAHRQNPRVIRDLASRLRSNQGPRAMLATTNPGGHDHWWYRAHPTSPRKEKNWKWVHASSLENPTLPSDYIDRLETIYRPGTAAHDRWVLGLSSALEGTVFEQFIAEPGAYVHIIPPFPIDPELPKGRGLDFGLSNPTAVVWGFKEMGERPDVYLTHLHYQPQWSIAEHAERIREIDMEMPPRMVPADPRMWDTVHQDRITGRQFSTADEFFDNRVQLTPAQNDRRLGLEKMLELIAVDNERVHPYTLDRGAPRLFIFDKPEFEPGIQELLNLEWSNPEGTKETGAKDDVKKKNDHFYDATRYLLLDLLKYAPIEPVRKPRTLRSTSRGPRVGY